MWDASDPSQPRYLGGNTAMNAISVAASGDVVFAIAVAPEHHLDFYDSVPSDRYLWVLDARQPATLPEVGRIYIGNAQALSVVDDRVLVAAGPAGAYVVRFARSVEPAPTSSPGASRTSAPTETPWDAGPPFLTPTPMRYNTDTPTPITTGTSTELATAYLPLARR